MIPSLPQVLQIIHPDGWKFIAIFAASAFVLAMLGGQNLGWIGAILTGWCVYFFRSPNRVVPTKEGVIVSPADGIVCQIVDVVPPSDLGLGTKPLTRISIFLNVFDCHVNRIPIAGVVRKILYHEGQFLNASLDKASEKNERNSVVIETDNDEKIGVIQIAGLIARRIRCDLTPHENVETGQIFGLIRFGSRVDVYLPHGTVPYVLEGQRMIAGETVLAKLDIIAKPVKPARSKTKA